MTRTLELTGCQPIGRKVALCRSIAGARNLWIIAAML